MYDDVLTCYFLHISVFILRDEAISQYTINQELF